MRTAYLCDFDGTVAPEDIGATFVRRFSNGRARELRPLLERWRAGEVGSRELAAAECRLLTVSEPEALAFARGFALDPGFDPFVREVEARGGVVEVVSEGFDFYVRALLERAGLGALAWSAVGSRFVAGGFEPVFPPAEGGCGRCANCKGRHVRERQALGYPVVLVGDGYSDRCGARAADRVVARGDLLEWCRREGIAATPFETFADVAAIARRAEEPGPAAGGPRREGA
jgi:HAD superfamily phosphoserine phosphatase-like hydrolase